MGITHTSIRWDAADFAAYFHQDGVLEVLNEWGMRPDNDVHAVRVGTARYCRSG